MLTSSHRTIHKFIQMALQGKLGWLIHRTLQMLGSIIADMPQETWTTAGMDAYDMPPGGSHLTMVRADDLPPAAVWDSPTWATGVAFLRMNRPQTGLAHGFRFAPALFPWRAATHSATGITRAHPNCTAQRSSRCGSNRHANPWRPPPRRLAFPIAPRADLYSAAVDNAAIRGAPKGN